jgi:hypothetical protein
VTFDHTLPMTDALLCPSAFPEPCLDTQIDDTPLRPDQEATPPTTRAKPKPWERNFSPVVEATPETPTSQPTGVSSALPGATKDAKEVKLNGADGGDASDALQQQQHQQHHQKQQQEQALDVAQALGMGSIGTPSSVASPHSHQQNGAHQLPKPFMPAQPSSLASLLSGETLAEASPGLSAEAAAFAPKSAPTNPLGMAGAEAEAEAEAKAKAKAGTRALSAAERMEMLGDADEGDE